MRSYAKNLPHILPNGAIYFVTFRLFNSIPLLKLNELKEKFELQKSQSRSDDHKLKSLTQKYHEEKDLLIEQIEDGQYLSDPAICIILKEQIHKYDREYYDLICYCIMPNHAHLILDTSVQINNGKPYVPLNKILQLLKGASANYANKLLNRSGSFWLKENYDHYVRSDDELDNIHMYILQNPVKAKLTNKWQEWPNTFTKNPPE